MLEIVSSINSGKSIPRQIDDAFTIRGDPSADSLTKRNLKADEAIGRVALYMSDNQAARRRVICKKHRQSCWD